MNTHLTNSMEAKGGQPFPGTDSKFDEGPPDKWVWWEYLWIFVISGGVVALSLAWLNALGLDPDESLSWPAAVKLARGSPDAVPLPWGLYLFNRPLPLMIGQYIGPLDAYLYGLSFAVFGVDVEVFRLTNVAVSVLVLVFTYVLARQFGGRPAAVLASFFLAVDIEFLLRAPTNSVGPILLQILAATIAVLLIYRSIARRSGWQFATGCFFLGLGLAEKLTFLLFLPSLFVAVLLFYWPLVKRILNWRTFSLTLAAFCAGCFPILAFIVGRPKIIIGFAKGNVHSPEWSTILQKRFVQFDNLFNRMSLVHRQLREQPDLERFNLVWWLFWVACTLVILSLLGCLVRRRPLSSTARKCGFLAVLSLGIVAVSGLLPMSGTVHHLMLVFPFTHCLAAITVFWVWRLCRSQGVVWGRLVTLVLTAAVAVTVASTAQHMRWYIERVNATGGLGYSSSEIYELARWVDENPNYHYVIATWSLNNQVYSLTEGRCSCRVFYFKLLTKKHPRVVSENLSPSVLNETKELLSRRQSMWLFSRADPRYSTVKQKLFEIAGTLQLEPRLRNQFYSPNTNQVLYEAYSFQFPNEMRIEDISWRNIPLGSVEQKTWAMDPDRSVLDVSETENRSTFASARVPLQRFRPL